MNKIKNGFTLLELLVVVLIIGILAGIALPQYRFAVLKSKYATLKAMSNVLYEAEQRYYMVHNEFANNLKKLDVTRDNNILCSISDNYVGCFLEDKQGKNILNYLIKLDGTQKRCTAYSLDATDILNRICKTETKQEKKPYCNTNSSSSVKYCAYSY